MPRYCDRKNWENRGNVKIIPNSRIRRLPILKQILPYRVGDKVIFDLHFDKPNTKENSARFGPHAVFEQFNCNNEELLDYVNETKHTIEGHTIPIEGDIVYRIGNSFSSSPNKTIIFTTTVQSRDTLRMKLIFLVIGAMLSLVCGFLLWLLGFIELVPAWKAWIVL